MKYKPFRVIPMTLCLLLAASLCGCGGQDDANETGGDNSPKSTQSFTETINDVPWEVSYYPDTHEIVSISTPHAVVEQDRSSEYYKFSAYYYGDSTMYVIHSLMLFGYPVGGDWYKIEQVEAYIMPYTDADDWSRIKNTFPSCTYDAENGYVTLSQRTTRYEEKLVFSNMPA